MIGAYKRAWRCHYVAPALSRALSCELALSWNVSYAVQYCCVRCWALVANGPNSPPILSIDQGKRVLFRHPHLNLNWAPASGGGQKPRVVVQIKKWKSR
jgi:hypothetical protein